MDRARQNHPLEDKKVISPFAQSDVAVSRKERDKDKFFWTIGISLLLVTVGTLAGIFITRYVNDPYRTLESFSVTKYLNGYQALAGSKYKAEFRVEADLGWKEGAGRLMLFSTADDSRPIAVFIPAVVGRDIYFTKGQTYLAEIEVKEGGLIYANSCQKN